ncbi:MAG: patatin-like phospholipase family protein [Xanthobacteraceae bacterium]
MLDFVKRRASPPGDIAADPPLLRTPRRRPSIGLALGGGAARGFSHIGVLRTLQKHGIDVQVIAGTSIGAVAGGLYAAGRLDSFEEWARSLTWRRVFGYLDFSITGSGLIGGGRLSDSLTREIAGVRIEDLPLKLATIATEIGTGHEIWLTRGLLTEALAASYALPGLLPPVSIGGRWLMDGALVNPVPVSAVRASGARLVIAVNLSGLGVSRGTTIQAHHAEEADFIDETMLEAAPPARGLRGTAERLLRRKFAGTPGKPGFSTVMIDAFNIMQDRITRARLAGDPPDVIITPKLDDVGFFDFHRADAAIAAGAAATEKSIEAILEAAESLA